MRSIPASTAAAKVGSAGSGSSSALAGPSWLMASITREEVNAAIKKYLQYDNMKIAIITGEAESMAAALESDTPSPMTYGSPKSDEVLEEDKVIESYPLEIASVRTVPVEEIFGD